MVRLTDPEFHGRLTGTPGSAAAAAFAADRLATAGLRPPAGSSDYFQRFPVTVAGVESASMELLPASAGGKPAVLVFFKDFLPMLFSGTGDVTGAVVFAGLGITAPALGRDDYAGVDVAGRVVMTVRGAPEDGRDWAAFDSHRARTANARAHGAAGFLFAEAAVANPNGDPVAGFPMATISEDLANALLADQKLTLEELRRVLAKGGVASFSTGRSVHLAVSARTARDGEGANVVGVLAGSDPTLAGEYVLIGAHLDHCGDWPVLLAGADDNASGSATVLEIARAASGLRPRPRRSLVFVLFGGEEEGLVGSRYFVQHPLPGLERCVAVFNLDMVGEGNGAWVAGGKNFPALFHALEEARDRFEPGMLLEAGLSQGEPRADHGPFQQAGIQAVSLFGVAGSHHGYHTGEDTVWWITPRTLEAMGRLVMGAAVALADAP